MHFFKSQAFVYKITIVILLAACGEPAKTAINSLDYDTPPSTMAVALFPAAGTSDQFYILANAIRPVIADSFEYCFGELNSCNQNSLTRKKMKLADLRNTPVTTHMVPGLQNLSINQKIHFFARPSDGTTLIAVSVTLTQVAESTTATSVAAQPINHSASDLISSRKILTGVDYDYGHGNINYSTSSPSIKLKITNPDLLSRISSLGAVIAGHNLNNTGIAISSNTSVRAEGTDSIIVTGVGFDPGNIYRLYVVLYDMSNPSSPKSLGSFAQPYYLATEDNSGAINRSRVRIAMRTFSEYHDWENNRFDRSKGYANDPGYGWCHMYYNWAVKEQLKSTQDHSYYNTSDWQQFNSYYANPGEVVTKSTQGSIMGDFIRLDGHSAMLIAYDTHLNMVWTIEGNFNSRVEIHKRPISGFWYGHLVDGMVR